MLNQWVYIDRVLYSCDGWYVQLRDTDICQKRHKRIKIIDNKVYAGPFLTKAFLKIWFIGFISMHGSSRNHDTYIPDKLMPYIK